MQWQNGKVKLTIEFDDYYQTNRLFNSLTARPPELGDLDDALAKHLNQVPEVGPNVFTYLGTKAELSKLNGFLQGRRAFLNEEIDKAFCNIGEEVKDISDYRAWRSQGPDECPCGIRRAMCSYHK
jgi:hypothetical protein